MRFEMGTKVTTLRKHMKTISKRIICSSILNPEDLDNFIQFAYQIIYSILKMDKKEKRQKRQKRKKGKEEK